MFLLGIWRARSNVFEAGPFQRNLGWIVASMVFVRRSRFKVSCQTHNQREICIPDFLWLQLSSFKALVNRRAETQAAVAVWKWFHTSGAGALWRGWHSSQHLPFYFAIWPPCFSFYLAHCLKQTAWHDAEILQQFYWHLMETSATKTSCRGISFWYWSLRNKHLKPAQTKRGKLSFCVRMHNNGPVFEPRSNVWLVPWVSLVFIFKLIFLHLQE